MIRKPDFRYVQIEPSSDGTFDLCHVYVFFIHFVDVRNNKECRLKYVGRAEIMGDVIAIKFYASRDRKSKFDKYSLAHGQMGVTAVLSIFHYCLRIISDMMTMYPSCSFVFKGAEAFDPATMRWENEANNQRFRIYRSFLAKHIGAETFSHYHFPDNSIYLLLRRNKDDKDMAEKMVSSLYKRFGL